MAHDVADGAPGDVAEGIGESVESAEFALVEHGEQDAFFVGDLLGEHAAAGAGLAGAAAALVGEPLGLGGLSGGELLSEFAQLVSAARCLAHPRYPGRGMHPTMAEQSGLGGHRQPSLPLI